MMAHIVKCTCDECTKLRLITLETQNARLLSWKKRVMEAYEECGEQEGPQYVLVPNTDWQRLTDAIDDTPERWEGK